MSFVHLHVHTQFSFLDGVPTLDDLAERVVEIGQTACAITDHGEVSGHFRWQKSAREAEIKPIFGMEGYFTEDRTVKTGQKGQTEAYDHITLLAVNNEGLRNLWTISSLAYTEGFYYKPRLDWDLLTRYGAGIVATSGCMNGCVAKHFAPDADHEFGLKRLTRFQDLLGDRFYIEVHTFKSQKQYDLNAIMMEHASTFGVPLLGVSDAHYLRAEDWEDHELLLAAQFQKTYDDPSRYSYGEGQLHLMDEEEVRKRLSLSLPDFAVDEAVANTVKLADQCDVEISVKLTMPTFLSKPADDVKRLRREASEGLARRRERTGASPTGSWDDYEKRLEYEQGLVIEKGFAGYFLIIQDTVVWAKSQGILVGPSRGSVGGSLLAYVMGITEVDPLRAGLIFERFLDPGRKSLPDIDVDLPPDDRDRVRKYLEKMWHVVAIGTFSALEPRALLRRFSKVLKIPEGDVSQMSKVVGQVKDLGVSRFEVTWDQVLDQVGDDLRVWIEKYPRLFDLMTVFRGHIDHASSHAGGLVVDREQILGRLPLRFLPRDKNVTTQFGMDDVEELGFVKMDFLGVRNLGTLAMAHDMVSEFHVCAECNGSGEKDGEVCPFCYGYAGPIPHFYDWQYAWPTYYEEEDIYTELWTGANIGIFQLESSGLRNLVKRFKPRDLHEVADLIAVFRPGITRALDKVTGMNLLEAYLSKREGKIPVIYRHPDLEPILGKTLASFLYQEQIMQTAGALAGFSLVEQDRIRKILGKLKRKEMVAMRDEFVSRSIEHSGLSEEVANQIFDDMESFGSYGFNQAHAWAYAQDAHWCAWMKHHWPRQFLTSLMRTDGDGVPLYIREARRLGISVLGPDVHESGFEFTLTSSGVIRYGLSGVKFVASAAKTLVKLRPFESLDDIFERVPKKLVNKRAMLSLMKVGALDSLVDPADREWRERLTQGWSLTKFVAHKFFEHRGWKKMDDDHVWTEDTNFDRWCREERVDDLTFWEPELLGLEVSYDPFDQWMDLMVEEDDYVGASEMFAGEYSKVCGIIRKVTTTEVKKPGSKTFGRKMGHIYVERPIGLSNASTDNEQIVVFPDKWDRYRSFLEVGAPVMAGVQKLDRGGGIQLVRCVRFDRL
jgi:DNA polymerase III subunit alpha